MEPFINIVLVEPEIPPNTGTIGRLCVALDIPLYLIGKLGFSIDDKHLKRAGLDYWQHLTYEHLDSLDTLYARFPDARFFYATKKGKHRYFDIEYKHGDFLVFGKETAGLSDNIIKNNFDSTIYIPMVGKTRSINLANAVSIVAYEAFRQIKG